MHCGVKDTSWGQYPMQGLCQIYSHDPRFSRNQSINTKGLGYRWVIVLQFEAMKKLLNKEMRIRRPRVTKIGGWVMST